MHPGIHAARTPEKAAVIVTRDERGASNRLTYAALERRSDALARALRARGMTRGDVVALCMGNTAAFFVAAWAAQRSGLYYVAAPTMATAEELAYLLEDSGAKAVLVDASLAGPMRAALRTLGAGAPALVIANPGDVEGFESLAHLEEAGPHEDYEAVEGSDMLYTSGTTGRPKGVKHALKGDPLGSDHRRVERARVLYGFDAETVFLVPAPLYHAAPLRFGMTALRLGGTIVLLPKFDPEAALAALRDHAVTHSQWVPTMFHRLLALPGDVRAAFPAVSPRHRLAMHSGAPCSVDVKRRMIDWWGPILHEYYSGSESVGFTHATSAEWLARPGTVGRAFGCKVHVLDGTGEEVGAGVVGSIFFESAQKLAYHNAPEKTAAALDRRGWATMGDLGYLDEDGYLFLTDRKAFTIVSGGVNIYPREVEAALETHPDVREAAVFGVPDADLGERVHAVVAVSERRLADPTLASELARHLRRHIAANKVPRGIDVRTDLPRGATGKLDKRALRHEHLEKLERGAS